MKVLAFGEILWDVIEGVEHLGGAPFNFAAHSAKCGNESYIISRLGGDFLGMRAFNQCNAQGVHVEFIQWDDTYPTGRVDVTLESGQPNYLIHENVAYDFIEMDRVVQALKHVPFDFFYFGSLAQRNRVSATTLSKILTQCNFKNIFYDVNLRKSGYSESIIRKSLNACTIFKLNADEMSIISELLIWQNLSKEKFCDMITKMFPNVKIIIITAAEKGCFVFEKENLTYVKGIPVSVSDAVGAGDAFSAAFIHKFARTGNAVFAAEVANQIGAYVASQRGAIPDYSEAVLKLIDCDNSKTFFNAAQNIL
jgi:fructokinase